MDMAYKRKERIVTDTLIKEYCMWLQGCEKSKETIKRYQYHLCLFMRYLNGRPASKEIVIMWKGVLRENMAPVTVNGALAALNGFFNYCKWLDCKVKFLKISRNTFCSENKELSKTEYKRLVNTALKKGNERLALLLQTICSTGIRVSELPFITVEAAVKGKAEVDCKGKVRTVFLTRQLSHMLIWYAQKQHIKSGMIFITRNGAALDRSNIWRDMKALGKEAGVTQEKIYPHNLRHLFARSYYDSEKDLSRLADILGHSNVNTTRIYTVESGYNHVRQLESLKLLVEVDNRIPLLL
ncbi:tyrosine-type recombinase/integrase [Lacrimispora sp.]|uniref:tyrosine-type recombinase/integrase n=1 Tax=Lacrimispora sp. TaxID=2719234 RepID=UPI002F42AA6E